MAIDGAIFRAHVSTPFPNFRNDGWLACQERCLGFSTRVDHRRDFFNFWTFEILRLCAPGHASAYPLEDYKTVLILETPFCVAGAAELMKLDIIVLGASNKSGRH